MITFPTIRQTIFEVKVTGCSNPSYWYNDNIGEVFQAYQQGVNDVWVVASDGYTNFILKQDCEPVKEGE